MSHELKRQRSEMIKFGVFLAVAAAFTAYLVVITGNIRGGDTRSYRAEFDDISGLSSGDQVRIASVPVGEVTGVTVTAGSTVMVDFKLDEAHELTTSTTAAIRYRNLVGDRYLELAQDGPPGDALDEGDEIPLSRTRPALDLDTLLEGFRPLFRGLSARQVNQLAQQLTAVLNGQESAVQTLLATVASLAPALADRDALISSTLDNLDQVVGMIDARRDALGSVILEVRRLVGGLAKDDDQLFDAASQVSELADTAAGLAIDLRHDLDPSLIDLATTLESIEAHGDTLEAVVRAMPQHYRVVLNAASYGNFFNFFLCGVRLQLTPADGATVQSPWMKSDAARCQP